MSCCKFGPIIKDGVVVGFYWSCSGDPDERMAQYAMEDMEQQRAEMERDAMGLFDPNRIDTRRARKEFGDRNMVNLGRRANRVPSNARRI